MIKGKTRHLHLHGPDGRVPMQLLAEQDVFSWCLPFVLLFVGMLLLFYGFKNSIKFKKENNIPMAIKDVDDKVEKNLRKESKKKTAGEKGVQNRRRGSALEEQSKKFNI